MGRRSASEIQQSIRLHYFYWLVQKLETDGKVDFANLVLDAFNAGWLMRRDQKTPEELAGVEERLREFKTAIGRLTA